jgi:hypothetical protein
MTAFASLWPHADAILAWGLCATILMTTILEGSHIAGLSRMSLPFLFGTFLTGDRRKAMLWGYLLYALGGWLFALLYAVLFATLGGAGWQLGAILGFGHGMFLCTVLLPLIAYIHPRMVTAYDGPDELRMLEPPGPFGLNYGWGTPLAVIAGQTAFGTLLGAVLSLD